MTYASEHQATAELEWLVHLEATPDVFPRTIPFSEIDVPDDVATENVDEAALLAGWHGDVAQTQRIGDAWLESGRTALLFVPSAVVPARNVLLNPAHRDAGRIRVTRTFDFPLDSRLSFRA